MTGFEEERTRRIRQYVWESAFFLLSLAFFLTVIYRALRAEAKVLQEQDNFLALVSASVQDAAGEPATVARDHVAARALSEQQRPLIDRMLSDLGRWKGSVTRILDSVRIERGRVTLRNEPIDLAAAVNRVVGQLNERASKDRVDFSG